MKPKTIYAIYCFLGTVLPLSQFLPWLFRNGLDVRLFLRLLFANPISSFFAADVFVAAVVVIRLAATAGSNGLKQWWVPVLATLCVGVSLGLPLLLLLREQQRQTSLP